MRHLVDPRQSSCYDPFEHVLAPAARKHLQEGWQGVFRETVLEVLPVEVLAPHFHQTLGRPTKELYAMAGLLFIQEFRHWTAEQAAEAFMLDVGVQYALNRDPALQTMTSRTVERYRRLFREEDLAQAIFERVTAALVEALDLKVQRQRLDSTHLFSQMALFGRTQLMGVAIKRFLTQLKRHDKPAYDALPEALRTRYAPSVNRLFADTAQAKDAEAKRRLRQEVAEDLYGLIERFGEDPAHQARPSYQALAQIFAEQCEVVEAKVKVKGKAGGRVMQNPSDPGATFDGHKGSGYQAQLAETCAADNPVQLITAVLPQTAADADAESYEPVQDDLARRGLRPEVVLADTSYGSDANVQAAKEAGVDLVSPVNPSKRDEDKLHPDDFDIDPKTEEVRACPAGHPPVESTYDPERQETCTRFEAATCAACPQRGRCPAQGERRPTYRHTPGQRRRAQRGRQEQTPAFRETYAKRAGIEGTIGRLKRTVGLGRLRVRGQPAVFQAIYLKVAGWNVLQGARARRLKEQAARRVRKQAASAPATGLSAPLEALARLGLALRRALRALTSGGGRPGPRPSRGVLARAGSPA